MNFSLKKSFENAKKRPFVVFVRLLFLFSLTSYIIVRYNSFFIFKDLSHRHFIHRFLTFLVYGVAYNFGIYFITTEAAKSYRILSTILYLPAVILSPMCMDFVLDRIFFSLFSEEYPKGHGIPLLALIPLSFFIYYCFNPWRKVKNVF